MSLMTMFPAHPPLPTARNFPFQFCAGIHNSISMCESDDGVSVAATRQNSGNCLNAGFGRAGPGTENVPAPTVCAVVIFTPGNASDVRLSQLPVEAGAAPGVAAALIEVVAVIVMTKATRNRARLARTPAARRRVVDI